MCAMACEVRDLTLPQLPLEPDLFGRVLLDFFEGRSTEYYLRRDDGRLDRDNIERYFCAWEKMPAHQRCLLNHARGRVLDVGAGAGQHALVLQERGLEVTAIDTSPLAVELCRQRGVRQAEVMDAHAMQLPPESFDTVLFMSNNLGIAGSPEGMRALLLRLHELVRPGGQILADFSDGTTYDPDALRYQRMNSARGRYPSAISLHIEYDEHRGPEFDWLLFNLSHLRALCAETGWRVARCVQIGMSAKYAIGLARV